MYLTIAIVLVILLVVFLLFTPFIVCIDTTSNQYFVQIKGLVKATFERHEEEVIMVNLHVLLFNFHIFPLRYLGRSKKNKPARIKGTKKRRRSIGIRKALRLIKTFEIKRFTIDIDTEDCIENAKLYPFFALLNYRFGNFNINFEGRNHFALYASNRPINILKIFINH